MRIHKTYTYVEDRDFYVDFKPIDLRLYKKHTGDTVDFADPFSVGEFYNWLVSEMDLEEESDDYDNWYGNSMGEETNTHYRLEDK